MPRIRETLSALIYSIEVESRLAEAKSVRGFSSSLPLTTPVSLTRACRRQNLDVVNRAISELKNPKIFKLLELALVAGNYLNSGGKQPKGPAGGFRLQSLLKVSLQRASPSCCHMESNAPTADGRRVAKEQDEPAQLHRQAAGREEPLRPDLH